MRPASLAVLCAATLTACGAEEESTPAACLNGSGAFLAALRDAPDQVALTDGVPISDCLIEDQPGGELSQVGAALVVSAERLAAPAGIEAGMAPLRLGYLVGAVERGAEETGGVHADLVRRLESVSASGDRPAGPGYSAAYDRGLRAGREGG
jgi:hypothetical protein